MGSFLFGKLPLVVFVAASVFMSLDINKHGSFEGSKTWVFLKDTGTLPYFQTAVARLRTYSQQAYRWSLKHAPAYLAQAREALAPLLLSVRDLFITLATHSWTNIKLIYQYFVDKKPLVVKWVPVLSEHVSVWLTVLMEYTLQLATLLWQYVTLAMQWLTENVFIGKLSPENLQNFTLEAINKTQSLAAQTLSWFNKNVVSVSSPSNMK